MKATTMLDTIRSLLGVPACAIPLSVCKTAKSYLLARAGISTEGTAVLFAAPYLVTADVADPRRNLSLYAVPRDYHGYMKELEATMLPSLSRAYPHNRFALFSDHSPICEVDAAARAGLGVLGLNGLLITPDYGSFVFIGEVITDANYATVTGEEVPQFPQTSPLCEGCGACLAACPTGCREGERTRCLSALTHKKGELTQEETESILSCGLVWGCDACQLACPHNATVMKGGKDTPLPYFREQRLNHLEAADVAAMGDEDFSSRAYAWRGRAIITRNCRLFEGDPTQDFERKEP